MLIEPYGVTGSHCVKHCEVQYKRKFNCSKLEWCFLLQEWGVYAYKIFNTEAQKLGMCVADSIMLYRNMNFERAAQRVIDSGAEVGRPGVGVTKPIASVPLFSQIFFIVKRHLLNIAFIFDRCRRSSAAGTPVKYEYDSRNLACSFARSKILLTEKLTNGALVTPTPVLYDCVLSMWLLIRWAPIQYKDVILPV